MVFFILTITIFYYGTFSMAMDECDLQRLAQFQAHLRAMREGAKYFEHFEINSLPGEVDKDRMVRWKENMRRLRVKAEKMGRNLLRENPPPSPSMGSGQEFAKQEDVAQWQEHMRNLRAKAARMERDMLHGNRPTGLDQGSTLNDWLNAYELPCSIALPPLKTDQNRAKYDTSSHRDVDARRQRNNNNNIVRAHPLDFNSDYDAPGAVVVRRERNKVRGHPYARPPKSIHRGKSAGTLQQKFGKPIIS